MNEQIATSRFQEVIEAVETLSPDDQTLLIEIVRQRLIEQRRTELAADIARRARPTSAARCGGAR